MAFHSRILFCDDAFKCLCCITLDESIRRSHSPNLFVLLAVLFLQEQHSPSLETGPAGSKRVVPAVGTGDVLGESKPTQR